jgi:hypothetical protein
VFGGWDIYEDTGYEAAKNAGCWTGVGAMLEQVRAA